jgi:hypothetical protein
MQSLARIYRHEGVSGFFNGGLVSCYKEGIFAGFFYALYSQGKTMGLNSFVAGILAGMISTSFTHPFEIVRAGMQSDIITDNKATKQSIGKQISDLFRNKGAFRGLAPRLIKKPLSNTFAFLIF